MLDRATGRPRGFGFITFESDRGVDAALSRPDLSLHDKKVKQKTSRRDNLLYMIETKEQSRNQHVLPFILFKFPRLKSSAHSQSTVREAATRPALVADLVAKDMALDTAVAKEALATMLEALADTE